MTTPHDADSPLPGGNAPQREALSKWLAYGKEVRTGDSFQMGVISPSTTDLLGSPHRRSETLQLARQTTPLHATEHHVERRLKPP